jgi:hypothetical protein
MKKLLILSAIAGFGGAALFYSHLLGIHIPDLYWRVLCPNMTSIEPKKLFFARSVCFLRTPELSVFLLRVRHFRAIVKHLSRNRS